MFLTEKVYVDVIGDQENVKKLRVLELDVEVRLSAPLCCKNRNYYKKQRCTAARCFPSHRIMLCRFAENDWICRLVMVLNYLNRRK